MNEPRLLASHGVVCVGGTVQFALTPDPGAEWKLSFILPSKKQRLPDEGAEFLLGVGIKGGTIAARFQVANRKLSLRVRYAVDPVEPAIFDTEYTVVKTIEEEISNWISRAPNRQQVVRDTTWVPRGQGPKPNEQEIRAKQEELFRRACTLYEQWRDDLIIRAGGVVKFNEIVTRINAALDEIRGRFQSDDPKVNRENRERYLKLYPLGKIWDESGEIRNEILQNSILRAISRIHQFDSSRPFENWFSRIRRNETKNYFRFQKDQRKHLSSEANLDQQFIEDEEVNSFSSVLEVVLLYKAKKLPSTTLLTEAVDEIRLQILGEISDDAILELLQDLARKDTGVLGVLTFIQKQHATLLSATDPDKKTALDITQWMKEVTDFAPKRNPNLLPVRLIPNTGELWTKTEEIEARIRHRPIACGIIFEQFLRHFDALRIVSRIWRLLHRLSLNLSVSKEFLDYIEAGNWTGSFIGGIDTRFRAEMKTLTDIEASMKDELERYYIRMLLIWLQLVLQRKETKLSLEKEIARIDKQLYHAQTLSHELQQQVDVIYSVIFDQLEPVQENSHII